MTVKICCDPRRCNKAASDVYKMGGWKLWGVLGSSGGWCTDVGSDLEVVGGRCFSLSPTRGQYCAFFGSWRGSRATLYNALQERVRNGMSLGLEE